MTGFTNASTGISGGAILVVSSPANVSVTVSKGDKSYTKNSGDLGSTTFKGLTTGTWTVTISGNGQTATRTIEITADYAITIAFFSATINITYPANSTCSVTDSGGQVVASDTNDTADVKSFVATVNATGTYTVTATATDGSGDTTSETVEITAEGQSVSVSLVYRTEGYLYNNGVFDENYERTELIQNTTITYNESDVYIAMTGNSRKAYGFVVFKGVKFDGQSTITVNQTSVRYGDGTTIAVVEDVSAWTPTSDEGTAAYYWYTDSGNTGNMDLSLDISAITPGTYDVAVGMSTQGGTWTNARNFYYYSVLIS